MVDLVPSVNAMAQRLVSWQILGLDRGSILSEYCEVSWRMAEQHLHTAIRGK